MKLLFISLVLAICAAYSHGLMCWKCTNAASLAECENKGSLVQCHRQQSCQSILRKHNGQTAITKGCKQTIACLNNKKQNLRSSGKSFQCNGDQIHSVCRCCCDTDKCNMGALDCVKEQVAVAAPRPTKKAVTEAVTCPKQSAPPHGEASCSDGNKQGSTCEFRCTSPDYSIYPEGADTNQCGADGKWTQAKPCCARPCPPFLMFDAAILYHASDRRSLPIIKQIRNNIVRDNMDINYDTGKLAGIYYDNKPVVSTRYNYTEYNENKTQLLQLIDERIQPTKTVGGIVNTGGAMWYAINYLYRAEMGARDARVPKILVVVTDSNSTDNVRAPSMAALRDGITPYIFAIEHPDRPLNREQIVEVAGTPDRTYFLSGENPNMLKFIDDLKASFCENPCDHVLHDHNQ